MFMSRYTAVMLSGNLFLHTHKEIWNEVTSVSNGTQCIFHADLQYRILCRS
jgi:hypothetical protein